MAKKITAPSVPLIVGNNPSKIKITYNDPFVDANGWIEVGAWVEVSSSRCKRIMYKQHDRTLLVEMTDGAVCAYDSVPPQVAKDMFNSSSIGKFIHERIDPTYKYKLVRKGTRTSRRPKASGS